MPVAPRQPGEESPFITRMHALKRLYTNRRRGAHMCRNVAVRSHGTASKYLRNQLNLRERQREKKKKSKPPVCIRAHIGG